MVSKAQYEFRACLGRRAHEESFLKAFLGIQGGENELEMGDGDRGVFKGNLP